MPVTIGPSKLIAQLILKGTLAAGGSSSKNIAANFYYQRIVGGVASDKAALSAAFLAGPYAAMLAAFNQAWSLGTSNIRFLDDALDPTVTTALAGAGAIATDRMPSYNAIFMLLQTGVRGKRFRGSKHFAAGNEADTTGDILSGAGLGRWQAVQTAILAPLVDGVGVTWNPCIVSFSLSQVKTNPTSVTWNPITAVILDLTVGTMRKRKVKTVI